MMKYYEFRGSFVYAVDSESFEKAKNELTEKLDEIFLSWDLESNTQ